MRIIVIGAGLVGSTLAQKLSQEGHSVTVIEKERNIVSDLSEKFDVLCLVGDATSPKLLKRAGIEITDLLIAVTDHDAVNILVGSIGARFGVPHRISRVRNREFTERNSILDVRPGELQRTTSSSVWTDKIRFWMCVQGNCKTRLCNLWADKIRFLTFPQGNCNE